MIKTYLFAAIFAVLTTVVGAVADTSDIPLVEGQVRKIDLEQQKITIRHGPLPHLDMDMDMTMVFRVAEPDMLDGLGEGDKIWFRAERIEGALTVTAISDSPGDSAEAAGHGHDGEAAHDDTAALAGGQPASYHDYDRTIEVDAADSKFDLATIDVKEGETIRFLISNTGELEHEFSIGTPEMHAAHQAEMMEMMEMMANGEMMQHGHGNSVMVLPGETRVLVWKFEHAHDLQFACNVPGHYEAGMHGGFNFMH